MAGADICVRDAPHLHPPVGTNCNLRLNHHTSPRLKDGRLAILATSDHIAALLIVSLLPHPRVSGVDALMCGC